MSNLKEKLGVVTTVMAILGFFGVRQFSDIMKPNPATTNAATPSTAPSTPPAKPASECADCKGKGKVLCTGGEHDADGKVACTKCKGTGSLGACTKCEGVGCSSCQGGTVSCPKVVDCAFVHAGKDDVLAKGFVVKCRACDGKGSR